MAAVSKNEEYQRTVRYDRFQGTTNADTLVWILGKRVVGPALDVGAGDGSLVRALRRRGMKVEGLDLSPQSEDVKQGSITQLPFPDATFASVFSTEVLEHLEDAQIGRGLAEVGRVLKPDGRLIVTVPFEEDFSRNMIVCPECKAAFHRYGHRQRFTAKSLEERLRASGFEPEFIKVYALGAMSILPLGRYFNWVLKRMKYDFIANLLIAVSRRTR